MVGPQHLTKETDILDAGFRKRVIQEIQGAENQARKHESYKRHEQYKDKTQYYVVDLLIKQFQKETVQEMQYGLSNISFIRKIINKLAKVYNNGAIRTVEDGDAGVDDEEIPGTPSEAPEIDPTETPEPVDPTGDPTDVVEAADAEGAYSLSIEGEEPIVEEVDPNAAIIDELVKFLKINQVMKKANRYAKLHKNTLVYTKPQKQLDEKYTLKSQALAPYLYDVIPSPDDPEAPLVVILSHYKPLMKKYYDVLDPGYHTNNQATQRSQSDSRDQAIADSPADEQGGPAGRFIWWSPKFHFTTDEKGVLIPNGDNPGNANPIETLPFTNFADDQDGAYWAEGGNDLSDGAPRLNALITHLNHVAVTQGYGQLAMTGKNLPKQVQVGPNHAIQMEYSDGDPVPTVAYLSSNPPLEAIMKIIEAQVSLLLTTNNLSTSNISLSLSDAKQFASGVAMMLDMAESTEDTQEQGQMFIDGEPQVWAIINKWQTYLKTKSLLNETLTENILPPEARVCVSFPPVQPVQAETERLDVYKKRKDLGLSSMIDLLMRDNPGMTREQAAKKQEEILAESKSKAAAFGLPAAAPGAPGAPQDPNDPNAKPPLKEGDPSEGDGGNGQGQPNFGKA